MARLVLHLLLITINAGPMAQTRPDFSGRWTIDAPRSKTSGGVMAGMGGFIEITQDADTMTVVVPTGIYVFPFYRFDGTEVTWNERVPFVKNGPSVYRSHWNRDRLITTIIAGEQKGYTETRYMDGSEMVTFLRVSPGDVWWKTYWKRVP